MSAWDNLSIRDKAEMMKVAIGNGITNINDIKRKYNEFAEGGPIGESTFTSELDWSPESWFSKRAAKPDGTYYNEEEAARLASHVPEYLTIEENAKNNGTWLQNSDGSKWEGDPRSWVMMQSEAYKKNYSAKPWYTGQAEWPTKFDYGQGAVETNKVTRAPYYSEQMWFSDNKDYGDTFANYQNSKGTDWRFDTPGEEDIKGQNFLAAIPKKGNYRHLEGPSNSNPDNWQHLPFDLKNNTINRLPAEQIILDSKGRNIRADKQKVLTDDVVNWSKSLGDQGIFMYNVDDGDVIKDGYITPQPVNEFISQPGFTDKVKFIEGNTGDFDINNPYKYAYVPTAQKSGFNIAALGGNLFADGGIHIKPSHRGRLTELKARTGKTEAELYNDGNPAHKKMVVFARNARKWHDLGGNLSYDDGITYDGGTLPELQVTGYAPIRLTTYYPVVSKYPYTGHSELEVPIDTATWNTYKEDSVFGERTSPYLTINKGGSSKDYNLITNNCADATLSFLNNAFNTKENPLFFTTPGDVRDYAINTLGGKVVEGTEDGSDIVLIPRNVDNYRQLSENAVLWHNIHDPHSSAFSLKGPLKYNKRHSLGGNLFDIGGPTEEDVERLFWANKMDAAKAALEQVNKNKPKKAPTPIIDRQLPELLVFPERSQGEITPVTGNALSRAINNYTGELKYDLANGRVPGGKYTLPAAVLGATGIAGLAKAGEMAYAAGVTPYISAGIDAAAAMHALPSVLNGTADWSTALELTPLIGPATRAGVQGARYTGNIYKALTDPSYRALHAYNAVTPVGYNNALQRGKDWVVDMVKDNPVDLKYPLWYKKLIKENNSIRPEEGFTRTGDYIDYRVLNRGQIGDEARIDAWALYNGLPQQYGTYKKIGDNLYSYNMGNIIKKSEGTWRPSEFSPRYGKEKRAFKYDEVTGAGGGLTNSKVAAEGKHGNYILHIEDLNDYQPFSRKSSSLEARLKDRMGKHGTASPIYKIENKILNSQTFKNLNKKMKDFEIGTITGGKPFKMSTDIPLHTAGKSFSNIEDAAQAFQNGNAYEELYGFNPYFISDLSLSPNAPWRFQDAIKYEIKDYSNLLDNLSDLTVPSSTSNFSKSFQKALGGRLYPDGGGMQNLYPNVGRAIQYFVERGLTDYQAAGLVGNLMRESSMNPSAVNKDSQAYGLAQWLGDRKRNLHGRYGNNPTFDQQLDYIWDELNSTHKRGLNKLKSSKTAEEAARNAMGYYEFSAGPESAIAAMNKYGQNGEDAMKKGIMFANDIMGIKAGPARYNPQDSLPPNFQVPENWELLYKPQYPLDELQATGTFMPAEEVPLESIMPAGQSKRARALDILSQYEYLSSLLSQ